jgi:hypothetical protein
MLMLVWEEVVVMLTEITIITMTVVKLAMLTETAIITLTVVGDG